MKYINFCGDSFCRHTRAAEIAWTTLLASKLNVNILGYGKSGAAHEHAIKTFDSIADYTVFCWTEPHRLYHIKYPLSIGSAEADQHKHRIYGAANVYYKYLHNSNLAIERQSRDLYWFDNVVLSKYKGLAIHIPCFSKIYKFTNHININTPLNQLRDNPDKFPVSKDIEPANHMTKQQNSMLADKLYNIIKQHV
jgi:hypothetical protein